MFIGRDLLRHGLREVFVPAFWYDQSDLADEHDHCVHGHCDHEHGHCEHKGHAHGEHNEHEDHEHGEHHEH